MTSLLDTLRDGGRRIRDAVAYAFSDPAWQMRYVAVAAVLLIPIIGYIAMLGWQARVYEHIRLGRRTLPTIDLMSDVGRGLTTFLNLILLFAVPIAVALFISLPLEAIGIPPSNYSDPELRRLGFVFVVLFTYPELLRRALVHGERLVMLKPFPSLRAIARTPLPFFLTVIASLVAHALTLFGIYAFLIGILFTAPIGHVVVAYVVNQWQRDIEGSRRVEPHSD